MKMELLGMGMEMEVADGIGDRDGDGDAGSIQFYEAMKGDLEAPDISKCSHQQHQRSLKDRLIGKR